MGRSSRNRRTLKAWRSALKYLRNKHLTSVIQEVENLSTPKTIDQFLSQYAWAVWVSGFREETIEKKWRSIKKSFCSFHVNEILARAREDRSYFTKISPIKNKRKIAAIVEAAKMLSEHGLDYFTDPFHNLLLLPYVGRTNRNFLLRNMGLADIAKDDVWLRRVAGELGYRTRSGSVEEMVETIHQNTRYSRGVVDVVLWRASQKGWKP